MDPVRVEPSQHVAGSLSMRRGSGVGSGAEEPRPKESEANTSFCGWGRKERMSENSRGIMIFFFFGLGMGAESPSCLYVGPLCGMEGVHAEIYHATSVLMAEVAGLALGAQLASGLRLKGMSYLSDN